MRVVALISQQTDVQKDMIVYRWYLEKMEKKFSDVWYKKRMDMIYRMDAVGANRRGSIANLQTRHQDKRMLGMVLQDVHLRLHPSSSRIRLLEKTTDIDAPTSIISSTHRIHRRSLVSNRRELEVMLTLLCLGKLAPRGGLERSRCLGIFWSG